MLRAFEVPAGEKYETNIFFGWTVRASANVIAIHCTFPKVLLLCVSVMSFALTARYANEQLDGGRVFIYEKDYPSKTHQSNFMEYLVDVLLY